MKTPLVGPSRQVGCALQRNAKLVAKTASSAIPSSVDSYCFKTKGSVPFILNKVQEREFLAPVLETAATGGILVVQ
jgi:hypothetical protein